MVRETYGQKMHYKRVQRLMRDLGIHIVIWKKKPITPKKEVYFISDTS
ncbi:hypothetical protein [Heyndrickxia oleronia]|nr:hypothetical protein [Heyndrickxia oleronia]MBU5211205.1 hypothetical protein [Heyndrickxia oleronia]